MGDLLEGGDEEDKQAPMKIEMIKKKVNRRGEESKSLCHTSTAKQVSSPFANFREILQFSRIFEKFREFYD